MACLVLGIGFHKQTKIFCCNVYTISPYTCWEYLPLVPKGQPRWHRPPLVVSSHLSPPCTICPSPHPPRESSFICERLGALPWPSPCVPKSVLCQDFSLSSQGLSSYKAKLGRDISLLVHPSIEVSSTNLALFSPMGEGFLDTRLKNRTDKRKLHQLIFQGKRIPCLY